MVSIKLWEVRTAKGLKLEAVAAITGVSKSTLNNIENVKTSPTLANLEKIAIGLGCRISDLYESVYHNKDLNRLTVESFPISWKCFLNMGQSG